MKITIAPSGEVVIDTDDAAQASALIREMQNGHPKKQRKTTHKTVVAPPTAAPAHPDVKLGPQLTASWSWLVANSNAAGVTTDQVASGLGITIHAATYRMQQLIDKGLAHRIKRGRYGPGEKVPQSAPSQVTENTHQGGTT